MERLQIQIAYQAWYVVASKKKVTVVGSKLIQEYFQFSAEIVFEVAFLTTCAGELLSDFRTGQCSL